VTPGPGPIGARTQPSNVRRRFPCFAAATVVPLRLLTIVSPADDGYARAFFVRSMENAINTAPQRRLAGMPAWLAFSLLTVLVWGAWGAVSKVASAGVDANTNQIFFMLGILPLILAVLRSPRIAVGGQQRRVGIFWAFLTGILGGIGNIAFFHALVIGGKALIVVPVTGLSPLVTVIVAVILLKERLGTSQKIGVAAALVAIYLLSV
jgi:bacterial/archaeal transporter family protein